MRGAVCYEFGSPLVVEDLDLPGPLLGEVQVKIEACAICHSDLSYMFGEWGGRLPVLLGHEASGVIEACGDGVSHVSVGDRVLVTLLRSCGYCCECAGGRSYICATEHGLDASGLRNCRGDLVWRGLRTGAFAERVVVDGSQVIGVGSDIDFAAASLLSCGVLTGFGSVVNVARVCAGESAVVLGCGGVGLNVLQGLRLSGAYPIIAIDLVSSKLPTALEFGATHAYCLGDDLSESSLLSEVMSLTGGGSDYVFCSAGGSRSIGLGFSLLGRGGALVIVGMTREGDYSVLDSTEIANSGKRILGSKMGSSRLSVDVPRLLSLYRSGGLLLDELISGRFSLDEINVAIDEVRADKALRHVIVF